MTDIEPNIQAYRVMAEVLLSFRKIVLRGLVKVSGDSWYLDACPPGVYERLVERKEHELAIERMPHEYEDLMSFATFGDLAEVVEYNDELARLLHNLAPSKEVLCARLTELEALRSKLSMARALSEDELAMLTSYSIHLRETLQGARQRAGKGARREADEARPAARPPDRDRARRVGASAGADARAREPKPEPPRVAPVTPPPPPVKPIEPPPAVAEAAVESARAEVGDGIEEAVEIRVEVAEADLVGAGEPRAEAVEHPGADVGAAADEVLGGDDEEEPIRAAPLVIVDPEVLAADMARALAEGDDGGVLRLLRREIIGAAEAMYRADDLVLAGWERVRAAGWFDERHAALGLAPLAEFYELVEGFQASRSGDASADELREFLAQRGFSKLLLTLREVFLRNGV